MELDDFKQAWQNATQQLPEWSAEQLQADLMQKIRQHSQSIYKRILMESAIGIGLVIFATWLLLQKDHPVNSFMAVVMLLAAVCSIFPIVQGIRAWQAEKKINFADNFLHDIRQQYTLLHLTFKVHLWIYYLLCVGLVGWLLFEHSLDKFMAVKIFLIVYFSILLFVVKYYLNWVYGTRLQQLKVLIEELEGTEKAS